MPKTRVHLIEKADFTVIKKSPPDLLIQVAGQVVTSGWTSPELSPFYYLVPPEDGFQDMDFLAERPKGTQLQVMVPIAADIILEDFENYWGEGKPLLGIRIHGASNVLEIKLRKRIKQRTDIVEF